jgi:hypothetical protein
MKKIKALLFTFLIVSFSIFIGIQVAQFVNPPAVFASSICECDDEECELGMVCVDNPGGNTWCDEVDDNVCKTYGCCDPEQEG